jgi:hypothetical protein
VKPELQATQQQEKTMNNDTSNEIGELKIEQLDAIVGGGQCGGGINWRQVGNTINNINYGVGLYMSGGVGLIAAAGGIQMEM